MREPSGCEWLQRLSDGVLSARELTERTLRRLDETTELNAVVARHDEIALADADAADVARSNGDTRPLLGLPVTVKDSIDVAGLPCTGGSLARKNFVPDRDATAVHRLRRAGAIVIAKTNVPEYTWSYETNNVLHGRTLHPHDPSRTPGGSSGGEAAILGADASVVGLGTDGGGSIRVPSHYCGIAGLRPTVGLVPETGCWPSTRDTGSLDISTIGPMGRYVKDLELLLHVISGPDGIDPLTVAVSAENRRVSVPSLRVGWYSDDGVWPVTKGIAIAVEVAAAALANRGCQVQPVVPPDVSRVTDLFFSLMATDGGERARRELLPAHGNHTDEMRALLVELSARSVDATGLSALFTELFALRSTLREFVGRYDIVLAPPAAGPAPLHGCTPGSDQPLERYQAFNYTHTFSVAGLPAVVVRVGEERGLPVGVQVIARPFQENVALAAASALEDEFGGFNRGSG